MAQARIEDLYNLYKTLETSMAETDTVITQVDGSLAAAQQEWQSQGAREFEQAWGQFKQSLTQMCQAFAMAGSDVAQQHNDFARAAKEADQHPVLSPMTSPR
jgi:uncharacterized protein YukE